MTEPSSRVSVDAVLECLQQLCADHFKRFNSPDLVPPELIPIALDERQRFTGLLTETLRVADGLLVDATLCGNGVPLRRGDVDKLAALNAAVESTLESYNLIDPTAELTLNIENDIVVIGGSSPYEVSNMAQRALRELLTALYHPDLRGASLVGLVWADDGLDDQHRTAAWHLLMQLSTLLGLAPKSTLLLFAGDADLNLELHCSGNPSLRAHISASGYERRRKYTANSESVRELSRRSSAEAPLVVLFLGAGASVAEGLPTGNELRNRALAGRVELPVVDGSNFREAAGMFFRQLQSGGSLRGNEESAGEESFVASLTLERVLFDEQAEEHQLNCATIRSFAEDHESMAKALADARDSGKFDSDPLVKLLGLGRRLVLVTVNFDRILEIKAKDTVRPYVDEVELSRLVDDLRTYRSGGGPVPLVKLHGDIDRPQSIVVNIEETAGGLTAARLQALEGILSVMREQAVRPWWYVGYSMRDLDLQAHWRSASFADVMVEHWVSPFVDSNVSRFIREFRQPRWDRESFGYSLYDRVVTLTATDFFRIFWDQIANRW